MNIDEMLKLEMQTPRDIVHTIKAGGPGSGRHKGFGGFKRNTSIHKEHGISETEYEHPKFATGVKVVTHAGNPGGEVHYGNEHKTFNSLTSLHNHLSTRYGISHGPAGHGAAFGTDKPGYMSSPAGRSLSPAEAREHASGRGVKTPVSAGGPGSGRKPDWGTGAAKVDVLNKMHNHLTKLGFRYSHSAPDSANVTYHRYEGNKKLSYSDGTQQTAFIKQHDGGHHTSEIY